VLQSEITEKQATAEKLREDIESGSAGVLRCEDEVAQLRERLSELEQQIGGMQQRGLELKGEIDRHDSRIQFNDERLRELASQNSKALADITQAEDRRNSAVDEQARISEQLTASEAALAQHRQALEAKRQALQGVEKELQARQEDLRNAQSEAFAAAQSLSRVRNEITALDLQKQGNVVRLEKLSAEKIQLEEERTRLEIRLQEFAEHVESEKLGSPDNARHGGGAPKAPARNSGGTEPRLRRAGQAFAGPGRETLAPDRHRTTRGLSRGLSGGALAALRKSRSVLGSSPTESGFPTTTSSPSKTRWATTCNSY